MPENDIAIRVENVTKRFRMYHNPVMGPIREMLCFWRDKRREYEEFLAVKDVTFEVRRGEVVGVVGPNGAGKTTLLKMIAGLLTIDRGRIDVNGRVTALLTLGVGVHPEFSGRENILYGGMMMGMSKREILAKMESIVAFAEIGEHINHPFRTYSSGMKARLLFSIAMSIDPDILIVDEALATGDAYFLQKARERILSFCARGTTILFVSHNPKHIREFCSRSLLLVNGQIRAAGTPIEVFDAYSALTFQAAQDRFGQAEKVVDAVDALPPESFVIDSVQTCAADGSPRGAFQTGEAMQIVVSYRQSISASMKATIRIWFVSGVLRLPVGELNFRNHLQDLQSGSRTTWQELPFAGKMVVHVPATLLAGGEYSMHIRVHDEAGQIVADEEDVGPFFAARAGLANNREITFLQPGTWEVVDDRAIMQASDEAPSSERGNAMPLPRP